MDVFSIAACVGVVGQIAYFGWKLGKIDGKVDGLNKQLNNGFICKNHSTITQQIGEIQGELKKPWNGQERRGY